MTQDATQKASVGILPVPTQQTIKSGIVTGIVPGVSDPTGLIAAALATAEAYTDAISATHVQVPIGGIIGWSGTLASTPPHFAVCNGVANFPGPDLTALFVT